MTRSFVQKVALAAVLAFGGTALAADKVAPKPAAPAGAPAKEHKGKAAHHKAKAKPEGDSAAGSTAK